MAAPAKLVTVHGTLFKLEGSYGAGGSLSTATDGVQADELPKFSPGYVNKGDRPRPPGMLGYQRKLPPSGKFIEFPFKHAPKGTGTAFTASNFWTFHAMLRACGYDAVVDVTGGSEKWTYTPTPGPTGYASGVASLYGRGELWPATGILGDFTWGFKGPEAPVFDFAFKGLLGAYTDVGVPTITYPNATLSAPKAISVPFTLFGVSQATLREATIKLGRTFQPRADVVSGGHLGFAPISRTPTLEVLVETPLIATQDFFQAWEQATNSAWLLTVGATQYLRMKWSGAAAQIMQEPKLEDDGAIALTRLTLQLNPSSPTANDDLQLVTD